MNTGSRLGMLLSIEKDAEGLIQAGLPLRKLALARFQIDTNRVNAKGR